MASTQPNDNELAERFLAAFNAIDAYLENEVGDGRHNSFRALVDHFSRRHRWWKDGDRLRTFTNLRNVMVHDKTEAYQDVCVPTPATVATIEAIRDRLLHPEQALPRFSRKVRTVKPADLLAGVLQICGEHELSHFPVVDGKRFVGLLTDHGITRWLAQQSQAAGGLVDVAVPVADVLSREEDRPNYEFVASATPVEHIVYRFHENPYLEAVIITAAGQRQAPFEGIVTRGDVLR